MKYVFIILVTVFLNAKESYVVHYERYGDDLLRNIAKSYDVNPVPETFEGLKKLLDSKENPITKKKARLGRRLFFETKLSKDDTVSCGNCHMIAEGGDDNKPSPLGIKERKNPHHINAPTVLNAALQSSQFWDGRVKTLEAQAKGPLTSSFEMDISPKEAVKNLQKIEYYKTKFKEVFPNDKKPLSFKNIRYAIAVFEKTLLTRSKFDKFLEGDNMALSKNEKEGFALFIQSGCIRCHNSTALGGNTLSRFPVRKKLGKQYQMPFKNIGDFSGKDKKYIFKTPILRNITKTAPYFHNGAVKELKKVIDIMARYQSGIVLTTKEIELIYDFLKTLQGKLVNYHID
jgi:cytochrome c peroxidase